MYTAFFFFFQAEDGIRDGRVTGVQTCALPILGRFVESSNAWKFAFEDSTKRPRRPSVAASSSVISRKLWITWLTLCRSEERRVGKEGRSRGAPWYLKKKGGR